MHGTLMKFEMVEAGPDRLVLTCHGGLSWEDRELLAGSVERYLNGRPTLAGIVMDMAGVEFVNSAGLGALFQLVQRLRGRGARLVLANVPGALQRLFRTVGLDHLARISADVPSALAELSGQRRDGVTPDHPASEGTPPEGGAPAAL